MIIRSFRVRFLLWNILFSGMVLAVFTAVALCLSHSGGLNRLDGDLRENARREFHEAHRSGFQADLPHLWRAEYGGGPGLLPMALIIREREGTNILLKSEAWPADLPVDVFADPELPPEDARPPRGDNFDRPPRPPYSDRPPRRDDDRRPPHRFPEGRPPPRAGVFGRSPETAPPPPPLAEGDFASLKLAEGNWRFGVMGLHDMTVIIGVPLQPLQEELHQLARVLLISFLPGLLLIGASGWVLTGRALRPLRILTKTAEGITARGLDQRLPVTQESREFKRLTDVFNGMLDRLEKSFQQATRFSADAAHELKTPLTVLQGQLEESLREAGDNPEHQQLCAGLLEEVQRLKNIVRKLLLLSLADAGELPLRRERIDLKVLLENAMEDAGVLAPGLRLELHADSPVPIQADPDLLGQVVQNLISNAIKYNGADGFIRMELQQTAQTIRVAVTNSGLPIPAADQPRLFERFYRGDPSRDRAIEGFGLGLSLSREIVRAHGGDLKLERSDQVETTFVLHIPHGVK